MWPKDEMARMAISDASVAYGLIKAKITRAVL
jgi:hypothetical protein